MPRIPIIMPQLGESIAEATVVALPFKVGDAVEGDQDILEVETNKATMGVTTPCQGTVAELLVELQQSYPVGAILGYLEVEASEAERLGLATTQTPPPAAAGATSEANGRARAEVANRSSAQSVQPTVRGLPVPAYAAGASYMSPRMKARMHELGLHAADLSGVAGSGAAGRVTVEDFEKFLDQLNQHQLSPASTMRVAVADAMRRSWMRPLATVGMPVHIDALLDHRKTSDPKPGPALYVLRALAIALDENSATAGRLVGDQIVHPRAIELGLAVEA
jgi:pyruvate/2-oxoglutarate dehydrogenase complex dihydrolipoamide acyltransferase (E2) component